VRVDAFCNDSLLHGLLPTKEESVEGYVGACKLSKWGVDALHVCSVYLGRSAVVEAKNLQKPCNLSELVRAARLGWKL